MKRFSESTKWADPWFRALSIESKCIWLWLLDNCDCAGIIEPDLDLAAFQIGTNKPLQSSLDALGNRVQRHGSKLFIPKFIAYQYGAELNLANTAHRGVIRRLEMAKIPCPIEITNKNTQAPSKPLQSPSQGAQDKDKDMDKAKESFTGNNKKEELCIIESPFLEFPPEAAKTMQQLMSRINDLCPAWKRVPQWNRNEMESLRNGSASQMQSLTDDDWRLLKAFYQAPADKAWFRFDQRHKFCENLSSTLATADKWKKSTGWKDPNSTDRLYY
jgi:hypothetical protein